MYVFSLCHIEWPISDPQRLWPSATMTILQTYHTSTQMPHDKIFTWTWIFFMGARPQISWSLNQKGRCISCFKQFSSLKSWVLITMCLLLVVWEAGQNEALLLIPWDLSTHTSDNCILGFSCFLPMRVPFPWEYLHLPTLYLAELKSPFEEWLAHSGYSILILEHVRYYFSA